MQIDKQIENKRTQKDKEMQHYKKWLLKDLEGPDTIIQMYGAFRQKLLQNLKNKHEAHPVHASL